jgi:hypothetical protein
MFSESILLCEWRRRRIRFFSWRVKCIETQPCISIQQKQKRCDLFDFAPLVVLRSSWSLYKQCLSSGLYLGADVFLSNWISQCSSRVYRPSFSTEGTILCRLEEHLTLHVHGKFRCSTMNGGAKSHFSHIGDVFEVSSFLSFFLSFLPSHGSSQNRIRRAALASCFAKSYDDEKLRCSCSLHVILSLRAVLNVRF